jgi:hypothetical protein
MTCSVWASSPSGYLPLGNEPVCRERPADAGAACNSQIIQLLRGRQAFSFVRMAESGDSAPRFATLAVCHTRPGRFTADEHLYRSFTRLV